MAALFNYWEEICVLQKNELACLLSSIGDSNEYTSVEREVLLEKIKYNYSSLCTILKNHKFFN